MWRWPTSMREPSRRQRLQSPFDIDLRLGCGENTLQGIIIFCIGLKSQFLLEGGGSPLVNKCLVETKRGRLMVHDRIARADSLTLKMCIRRRSRHNWLCIAHYEQFFAINGPIPGNK
ncbi:hypothetical protein CEXT_318291 [Caerostris extrusa]|uniref:Uncharacterized protein n=1 Tax=Caerostris extrusa TaxID=172846 RepID=A0AAV4N0N7_CAEEX|nr:hypothetical protein CEXT_318291 [Caerostris extrusa]